MKHTTSFLAVLLIMMAMPNVAGAYDFSAVAPSGQTLFYNISGNNVTVTFENGMLSGYSTPLTGNLIIPESVTYDSVTYSVTTIGQCAFMSCYGLTSVTFPNSLTTISDNAFLDCVNITSVTFGRSLTTIGNWAFGYCNSLASLTLPNTITSLGNYAFNGCSSITSLIIPNSLTSISEGAFASCDLLTSVTIPNTVTSIGDYAFAICVGLPSLTIPNSVTSIGEQAFMHCTSLTSMTFPNSVITIGNSAFLGCTALTSVTIPNSVTTIGNGAFLGCRRLSSVTFPNSVTTIGGHAFQNCDSLTSVYIPESVTSIGYYAFAKCDRIISIEVSELNAVYDSREDCNAIIKTSSNQLICGCKNTTIHNSVTSIGNGAFNGCRSLLSVTLPDFVTTIGEEAFRGCTGLTNVSIGSSVNLIDNYAFYDCNNLAVVNSFSTTAPTLGSSAFVGYGNPTPTMVNIPCGSLSSYQSAWPPILQYNETLFMYTLSVQSANEMMGSARVMVTPNCNNIGSIVATANYGYRFTQWNDGDTNNPRTITVTQDTLMTAYFTTDQFTVTVTARYHGTVSGGGTYDYGDTIIIQAYSEEGYHFARWNDFNRDNPRLYLVEGDVTLTAYFAPDPIVDTSQNDTDTLCPKPYDLGVISMTSGAVTLSWNGGGGASRWELSVAPEGGTPETGTCSEWDTTVATVTGLEAGGWHYAWVRSLCDSATVSGWSERTRFYVPVDSTQTQGVASAVDQHTNVMPNPASEMVSVVSSFRISSVEVWSLNGSLALRQEADAMSTTIDVSSLPRGTYILRISTVHGMAYKKLVVE